MPSFELLVNIIAEDQLILYVFLRNNKNNTTALCYLLMIGFRCICGGLAERHGMPGQDGSGPPLGGVHQGVRAPGEVWRVPVAGFPRYAAAGMIYALIGVMCVLTRGGGGGGL